MARWYPAYFASWNIVCVDAKKIFFYMSGPRICPIYIYIYIFFFFFFFF